MQYILSMSATIHQGDTMHTDRKYTVVTIGRATTKHYAPIVDREDGRVSDMPLCRFSDGRITWRSERMTKDEALQLVTCRACYRPR
jgi:hypothetical protein